MGQMTRDEIVAILRAANPPHVRLGEIHLYADAFLEYEAAQANIAEFGTIVFHPRTGAPIENPYCKIRDRAGAVLAKLKLRADPLWESRAGDGVKT